MCGGGLSKIFRGEVCRENVFSHTKQEGTMIAGRGMDEGKRVTFRGWSNHWTADQMAREESHSTHTCLKLASQVGCRSSKISHSLASTTLSIPIFITKLRSQSLAEFLMTPQQR
ncbi:hypothetical protein ACOSQ3_020328 [Xanthoceras sorbifolium]